MLQAGIFVFSIYPSFFFFFFFFKEEKRKEKKRKTAPVRKKCIFAILIRTHIVNYDTDQGLHNN